MPPPGVAKKAMRSPRQPAADFAASSAGKARPSRKRSVHSPSVSL